MTPDLDPDRRLALAYAPARARLALEALWRLDVTMGAVVARRREPMVARIRLAWWREALERLDGASPPPEPVLQALAAHLLPAGIDGAELAAMEEGWSILLAEGALDADALQTYARLRGGLLFRFSARLLGAADKVEPDGARWALVDLARHSANPAEAAAALEAAAGVAPQRAWSKSLRPLAMLSLLARRDLERSPPLEREGSPGRMLRLARYRLTGR
jgi:phytoene synthase